MSNENKPMERLMQSFAKGDFDVTAEEIFAPDEPAMKTPTATGPFKPGDEVFLIDGRKAEFVAQLGDKWVVSPFFYRQDYNGDFDEDEAFTGEPKVVDRVFAKAPVEVYEKRVIQLQEQIAAKQQEWNEISGQVRNQESSRKQLIAKLKQHEALRYVEEILDGKITHVVISEYDTEYKLMTLKESLKQREEWRNPDNRLISLYGKSYGDLQWKINEYYDGSGSNKGCWLFPSEELAAEFLRSALQTIFDTWDIKMGIWKLDRAIQSALRVSMPVPEHLRVIVKTNAITTAKKEVAAIEKQLKEKVARVEALETGATAQ